MSPSVQDPSTVELLLESAEGYVLETGIIFSFALPAEVTALHPSVGLQSGGLSITVVGRNFLSTERLGCRFGRKIVMAAFVSSTAVLCETVAHDAGMVQVSVTLNGKYYSEEGASFEYV
ncbi:hypothetical protein T484DRAFT_1649543, partial [Baffinella frigidus]